MEKGYDIMRNEIKNIVIFILSIFICLLSINTAWLLIERPRPVWPLINLKDTVPDEETAVKMAQVIYKMATDIDFETSEFKCIKCENNEWNVYLRDYKEEAGEYVVMGERGIYINKTFGTLVQINISESAVQSYLQQKEELIYR